MANIKAINENTSYIRLCVDGGVNTIPKLTVSYADNVSDTMVQILKIGFTDNADLWTVTDTRPYGNFIADGENGFLYVCVTDNDTNATKWHKFNLPSVDEGIYDSNYDCLVKTLGESDIIESWTTSYAVTPQGCCYFDNKLWLLHGGGVKDSGYGDAKLLVVDLNTKTIIATIDFAEADIKAEPESIDFYNDEWYYGTLDRMYKNKLKTN